MVTSMDGEQDWEDVKPRKKRQDDIINGSEEEPDFSDPEDFEEDVSDSEFLADVLEKKPKEADGIDAVIVVDNVPVVGEERLGKLKIVITKIFSKFGKIHSDYYPEFEGKTKGYIFIEYEQDKSAKDAVKGADGYKLDKSHAFRVNLFSDFEKYKNVTENWTPPEKQPLKDVGNLYYFLEDEDCNNQFSVIYEGGVKTGIFLNTAAEPSLLEQRERWTETYTRWSPKGAYLATFHAKGIALWGGEKFRQIQRFTHPGVQLIDFSPCERYLVTFSPMQDPSRGDDIQAITVWEIFTGLKKRSFHADMSGEDRQWPIFKFVSYDGKYFARKAKGVLSVYETPSMGLVDKKSIAIDGISEFFWSPADNMLAFWIPENNQIPARVTILAIPSKKEVRVKNLFNVSDIRLNWHKQGKFLCVKVDRYNKAKKANISNFEIFHIMEKQVPVDIVELKEQVIAFAWEPTGNKFCCLHGEAPRISAMFFEIKGGKIEHLGTMEKKQATHIFWSPAGQFVLLVGLNSSSQLEFIDTADMTVMNSGEHHMVSDVEWDPTGRYLVSIVSWWEHKIDNAYWVWSFQGRLMRKYPMEQLCQLLWRPKPKSILSADHIKKIRKNHKSFSKIFEAKDRLLQSRVSKEIIDKRRSLMEEFTNYRKHCNEVYQHTTPYRRELRNGVMTDEVDYQAEDLDEVTVEILIEEEETILNDKE
uniref:eukaryotic translation initiation factor 3 subunit B-like n=1 Tax=Ciona intestinalis TaxID=7719 RepID=UPI000180C733|nr:eukaryotic translation initiation factor 3 subunit B-like [Ciona intestinalis]|eukprot:XP_002130037.1 eukaryotic translation initiation factor 3 subunit B-like [Ciona intestinalis]